MLPLPTLLPLMAAGSSLPHGERPHVQNSRHD